MKNLLLYSLTLILLSTTLCSAREYHVSVKGDDNNDGSGLKPFKTIGAASLVAYPGDTITVHAGIYREWVNPVRGGESDMKRIVYRAAPGPRLPMPGSLEDRGSADSQASGSVHHGTRHGSPPGKDASACVSRRHQSRPVPQSDERPPRRGPSPTQCPHTRRHAPVH